MKKIILGLLILGLISWLVYWQITKSASLNWELQAEEKTSLASNLGTINIQEQQSKGPDALKDSRNYQFPNGDIFTQERIAFTKDKDKTELYVKEYPGNRGKLRYYDVDQKKWIEKSLQPGKLPQQTLFITIEDDTQNTYLILSQPMAYQPRENQCLEYMPGDDGYIVLEQNENSYQFSIQSEPKAQTQIEYWLLQSNGALVNWTQQTTQKVWTRYLLNDDSRFCYEGYYYFCPDSYYPTGANYFYLMPSPYVVTGFLKNDNWRAATDLSIAMLDILRPQQNKDGFWPTYAESGMLKDNYDMDGGFYDTRFNTELAHTYLLAYKKFAIAEFLTSSQQYGEFLLRHATNHHFSRLGSNGTEGWLVEDYWHPTSGTTTHVSLNHHTMEIIYLYELFNITGIERYEQMADTMLWGIKLSRQEWLLPDGNLVYGLLKDGTHFGEDYPYLAYNDLYDLQQILHQLKGKTDKNIQFLMDHKRKWMDQHGVTEYKK